MSFTIAYLVDQGISPVLFFKCHYFDAVIIGITSNERKPAFHMQELKAAWESFLCAVIEYKDLLTFVGK